MHRFIAAGDRVAAFVTADVEASMGVNSRVELAQVNAIMRGRILERLMLDGVTIDDPSSTYVDWGVTVGRDTVIRPQTMLTGATVIGARLHGRARAAFWPTSRSTTAPRSSRRT